MNLNTKAASLLIFVLLHWANEAAEARNPEAGGWKRESGKNGARGKFDLIEVDIKRRKSTSKVTYVYNKEDDSHTFRALAPYLIDRVTRGGQVLWRAEDHGNEYCNEVFVGQDARGKRLFRVFFPKEHEKGRFKGELDTLTHTHTQKKPKKPAYEHAVEDADRYLLNLNIEHTEATKNVKFEADLANAEYIFTAVKPFAFGRVSRGRETIWRYRGGDYPTRVFVSYDVDDNPDLSFQFHKRDPVDPFKYPRKIYDSEFDEPSEHGDDDDFEGGMGGEADFEGGMGEAAVEFDADDLYMEREPDESRALTETGPRRHEADDEVALLTKIVELYIDSKASNYHQQFFEDAASDTGLYLPQPGHFFFRVRFKQPLNENTLNFVKIWDAEEDGLLANLVLVGGLESPHSVLVFFTDGSRRFFHLDKYYQMVANPMALQTKHDLEASQHPKRVEVVTRSRSRGEKVNDASKYSVSVFRAAEARGSSLAGACFEYRFAPGAVCLEVAVRNHLVWERRGHVLLSRLHYLESLGLVVLEFSNLRTSVYKLHGKKWVLFNSN